MSKQWQPVFEWNGLVTFEDFWSFEAEWFEPPNRRRGGWSGAARCELKLPRGGTVTVFFKRQENHITRTWGHPISGLATLAREYRNLMKFARCQVPTLQPLYFGCKKVSGDLRAVLITEELTGFRSLESLFGVWEATGWPAGAGRCRIVEALARTVRRMHDHRVRHGCLYSKHLFLNWPPAGGLPENVPVEVRIIDLEKSRSAWSSWSAGQRDLDTLHRHSAGGRLVDRWRFLRVYFDGSRLPQVKKAWRTIAQRAERKRMKHVREGKLQG